MADIINANAAAKTRGANIEIRISNIETNSKYKFQMFETNAATVEELRSATCGERASSSF
jgi:hypothetical protein